MSKKKKKAKAAKEIPNSVDEILNKGEETINEGEEILSEEDLAAYEGEIIEEEVVDGANDAISEMAHEESKEVESVGEVMSNLAPIAMVSDDGRSFDERLTDFFTKYRKSKIKHIPALVEQYRGREEEVLEYLEYKYITKINATIERKRPPAFRSKFYDPSTKENKTLPEPKKKGGATGIIIVLVVLCALGAAGFMFKDKIAAMIGGAAKDKIEEVSGDVIKEGADADEVKNETSSEEQAKMDSIEAILDAHADEEDAETAAAVINAL